MASFFKTVDNKVIYTGDGELIYFIPEKYFDVKAATIIGNKISLLGVFNYAAYDSKGKEIAFNLFNAPTMIQCIPNKIEKETNYQLKGTNEPSDYRLLYFKNNDELICSTKVPVEFSTLEKFIDVFIRGNLPDSIPYNQIQDFIINNADLCKFDYNVSNQIIGIIISELYRDKNNLSKPFRLSNMDNMLDYKAISVTNVPKYTSPFTAITSDNADEALAAAMTISGNGKSPLEKIMMG